MDTPDNGKVYIDFTYDTGRTHRIEVSEPDALKFMHNMSQKYGPSMRALSVPLHQERRPR